MFYLRDRDLRERLAFLDFRETLFLRCLRVFLRPPFWALTSVITPLRAFKYRIKVSFGIVCYLLFGSVNSLSSPVLII
jgi:hypothetical protein